jgi:hypothetical protein
LTEEGDVSRTWTGAVSATAGVLWLAIAVAGAVVDVLPVVAVGLAVGSVALAVAACSHLFRSRGRVSFPVAVLAAALPAVVTLAVSAGLFTLNVLGWVGVTVLVFVSGTSLAYPLGVARTRRQRRVVVVALALLGELFVAAAVLDRNTHLEAEGLATLFAVALVPVFVALAIPLYVAGATVRRGLHEGEPPREPLLAAVALPWVAGVGAFVVPALLDDGLRGLARVLVGSAGVLGLPAQMPNPGLLLFLALGAVCYATVRWSVTRNAG